MPLHRSAPFVAASSDLWTLNSGPLQKMILPLMFAAHSPLCLSETVSRFLHALAAAMLYTGAMEKGQMHGKGALVYPNGEKYEGDFQHGKRHGYGVYSYADGGRFEGEWVDDKVHGRGVSIYSSGNR